MAKKLNDVKVNLSFTADTAKAKAELQSLQTQLSKIINMPSSSVDDKLTDNIKQASHAAAELKVHLEKALNVDTGNLDFNKLNQSLKQSNTTLTQYAQQLASIGPEGQKAFMMLAQSVASAEVPIRSSSKLLNEMWTTMKNTARWQLTSSMLHGFMGAVKSAVGYAEDLNESLNNIRIVTGNSVDQMKDFAKEANKAAKALSTSTVKYTNAALIYYQQGLDEKSVKERTNITVQMANVSRQSAEEVSDQLTSIWNNFYDGSQSLEHYADAMVRLGAETASSSNEIAQGLEKFAAIGDTIGLSFDNAAAALATVTATTRQSADIVGTAFKTIFARIQGLNLGETLDDGTTLNKYSEALDKVGISIFDQSGQLKDMNSILDEMGSRWQTLSKDQQTALAQTVAGVRQYTQLVALMDNYDFYQQNLDSATNSAGALKEQAEIYEESWEAANARLRASIEDIWADLIDDEAFIDIINTLKSLVDIVDDVIESIGGFRGVLLGAGTLFTKVFEKQISQSIIDATYHLKTWTKAGRESINAQRVAEIENMTKMMDEYFGDNRESTEAQVYKHLLSEQQRLLQVSNELSETELKVNQTLMDQMKIRGQLAMNLEKEVEQANKKVKQSQIQAEHKTKDTPDLMQNIQKRLNNGTFIKVISEMATKDIGNVETWMKNYYFNVMDEIASMMDDAEVDSATRSSLNNWIENVKESIGLTAQQKKALEDFNQTNLKLKKSQDEVNKSVGLMGKLFSANTEKAAFKTQDLATSFTQAASSITGITFALNSFQTVLDTFNNTEMTGAEKLGSALTAISMSLPGVISSMQTLMKLTGLGAGTIGLIIGGISALIWFFEKCEEAANADKIAFEKASKAADALAQSAKNAEDSINGLKDAFNNYSSLVDALNACTKGTDEWEKALNAVRQSINDIITTYPELLQIEGMFDENGLLNQEKYQEWLTQREKGAVAAQNAAAYAQVNKQEKNIQEQESSLSGQIYEASNGMLNYTDFKKLKEIVSNYSKQDWEDQIIKQYNGYISGNEDFLKSSEFAALLDEINRVAQINTGEANAKNIIVNKSLGSRASDISEEKYWTTYKNTQDKYDDITASTKANSDIVQNLLKDAGITESATKLEDTDEGIKITFADGDTKLLGEIIGKAAHDSAIEATLNEESVAQHLGAFEGYNLDDISKINLASYMSTVKESDRGIAEAYIQSLLKGNSAEANATAINNLFNSKVDAKIDLSEQAKKYDLDEKQVEDYANSLVTTAKKLDEVKLKELGYSKELENNNELAGDLAIAHSRLNKGLIDLASNFDENITILNESEQNTLQYNTALNSLRTSLAEALNLADGTSLTEEFIGKPENLQLIQAAINGDIESLKKLKDLASEDILGQALSKYEINDFTTASFEAYLEKIKNQIDKQDLTIGASLDLGDSYNSLNAFLQAVGMTEEEANDYFRSIGFVPKITQKQATITVLDENGYQRTETIQVAQITDLNYQGPDAKIVDAKAVKDSKKFKPEEDRYREINNIIAGQENALNKLARAREKAFGENKVASIDAENLALEAQIENYEELSRQQEEYKEKDLAAVQKAFGNKVQFDDYGTIKNYNALLKTATSDEQVKLLEQYEETINGIRETEEQIAEIRDQMADNYYEKITYELEYKLKIDDMALRDVEYRLHKYKDDPIQTVEALVGSENNSNSKMTSILNQGNALKKMYEDLEKAHEKGKITDEKYAEGLQDIYDKMYDQKQVIDELNEAMLNLYTETYDKALENIDKYIAKLETVNSLTEHYQNLLGLLGLGKNYDFVNEILNAQKTGAKNKFEVSQGLYNTASDELELRKIQYNEALATGDEEAIEIVKKNLEKAEEEALNAYNTMLQDATTYAQAIQDRLTSAIKQAAEEMEDTLTDDVGFEELNKQIAHSKEMADEYLTDTNKMYETNKLLNTIQEKTDKTSNSVAKQKYQAFAKEIKQLQAKGQLSQTELEIAQKRFAVLEAQIALEEAQNAKSTVRLQRDSEGNYGYVYTADTEKVAEAEQNLADAENDLYNTRLEAANKYTEKAIKAQQDYVAEIQAIDKAFQDGTIKTEEEWRAARDESTQRFNEKMAGYSDQYTVAIGDDARVAQEAWSSEHATMVFNSDNWETAIDNNTTKMEQHFKEANEELGNIAELMGITLTDLQGEKVNPTTKSFEDFKTMLDNVSGASNDLKKKLVGENGSGGLAGDLKTTLDQVADLTITFGLQNTAIYELSLKYDGLTKSIQNTIIELQKLQQLQDGSDDDSGSGGGKNPNDSNPNDDRKTPNYDNGTYGSIVVKAAQEFVGLSGKDVDGKWGNASKSAASRNGYNSLAEVVAAMGRDENQEGGTGNTKDDTSTYGKDRWNPEDTYTEELKVSSSSLSNNATFAVDKTQRETTPDGKGAYKIVSGHNLGKYIDISAFSECRFLSYDEDLNEFTHTNESGVSLPLWEKYDTGGFTGAWGPEGKLAMLHEKEIVLNKDDTANLLKTVGFIRELAGMIDAQAAIASIVSTSMYPNMLHSMNQQLDQHVEIHAEFPNATNHSEIEEAFTNLVNRASQFANRK